MKDLDQKIDRKFIDSIDLNGYEILTDTGWKDCKKIHKTIKYKIYELCTENHQLKCADTHIVFNEQFQYIFVKDLVSGMKIYTDTLIEEVISVKQLDEEDYMYDVELDDDSNHRYFTNGILSHNTTTYTVFCMWLATLFPEKKIMICSNKLQTSIEIMDRLRIAYEYLPKFIKPGILVYNKSEITFSNKSTIRAFATSSSASRGFSGQVVVIDEMAFIPKNIIDEFFASVMPVVSSAKDSKVIVVSTPNGTQGLYYDIWQQANSKDLKSNKEGWKPFRIDYWDVPGRDLEWKEKQIASIGKQRFDQEFGNEFMTGSSTRKLVPDEVLERYRMQLTEHKNNGIVPKMQKIVSQDEKEVFEFEMWHEFKIDRTYAASMDISEGVGKDASVLYIWDVTDLSNIIMCARFSSNTVSLVQFAYISRKILALYNDPYLAAERNGLSAGTLDSLRITYEYPNMVIENKQNEAGIYSHVTIKQKACIWAKQMLTTIGFGFTIYDKELIDELSIFCKKDTKGVHMVYQALPGPNSHDDHVMAFIWLMYMLHKDVIDRYFQVCQEFTDQFENIYPRVLQPMNEYTGDDLRRIKDNPLYKEFLDFKDEMKQRLKKSIKEEEKEDNEDIFKYKKESDEDDPYFQDQDGFNRESQNKGLNYRAPVFFI